MASVTVFLQAYDNTPDYPWLNRMICAWREAEDRTRKECGLPSMSKPYPGCFNYQRRLRTNATVTTEPSANTESRRMTNLGDLVTHRPLSAHDIIVHNFVQAGNASHTPKRIVLSDEDMKPVVDDETDWDALIASLYEDDESSSHNHRSLVDYTNVPYDNYAPVLDVRTEYYYRYSGSQTVPPCYGRWFQGNDRRQTNHWRIMKDPVRVSRRQVTELNRLLRQRIAPKSDPLRSCQRDTAGKPDPSNPTRISVARPLQSLRSTHFETFCECTDWKSKFKEDQAWCQLDQMTRLFDHPYNFETNGF
jgi:hypothetical protein